MPAHEGFGHRRQAREGFTLAEIVVAVVMIGLLARLAIPQYPKVRLRSQDAAVLNNARQLANAVAQYFLDSRASSVETTRFLGASACTKNLGTVAGEVYPSGLYASTALTVTGAAGTRPITCASPARIPGWIGSAPAPSAWPWQTSPVPRPPTILRQVDRPSIEPTHEGMSHPRISTPQS